MVLPAFGVTTVWRRLYVFLVRRALVVSCTDEVFWMYTWLMRLKDGSAGCTHLLPNPGTDTYSFPLYQFILAFALPLVVICGVFFKTLQNMSAIVASLPQRSLRVWMRKVTCMAVAICLALFICWAPLLPLAVVHLGVPWPTFAFFCMPKTLQSAWATPIFASTHLSTLF